MKKIKTIQEAFKKTGRPKTPSFSEVPEDMRAWFQALYNGAVITEAINEKYKADWDNPDQRKYFPYFVNRSSPAGFVFGGANYSYSCAGAGDASRLANETYENAQYASETFPEVFNGILKK